MANLEKFKERARKYEAKEQWAKAIEEYVKAIDEMEAAPEIPDAELQLYNRVGDLYQRTGDTQNAVAYYERAADRYHDIGLANNAIALCNKVVRLAPGRTSVYLKLGMLFASKGFAAEAKTNLLEYADRMQKAGQLEEAFKALKKFAEMTPAQEDIWSVLAQQARASAKTPDQKEQVEKLLAEFEAKERSAQQRKSRVSRHMITGEELPPEPTSKKGELIFLDLEPTPPARASKAAAAPAPPRPSPPPAKPAPAAEPPALEIEPTSLAPQEEEAPVAEIPALEIEPTSLAEEAPAAPVAEPLELEPTSLAEAEPEAALLPEPEAVQEEEPVLEPVAEAEPEALAEPEPVEDETGEAAALELDVGEVPAAVEEEPADATAGLPLLDVGEEAAAEPETAPVAELEELPAAPAAELEELPAAPAAELEELPAAPAAELEELPAAPAAELEELPAAPAAELEELPAEPEAEFELLDVGEVISGPTLEELQARIAADASDWEAHRLLAEALVESGERDQAFAEFDTAIEGLEESGEFDAAAAVAEGVLRLDRNSVRYHQKRVELAYRQGNRARLADAYLELADALLRSGEAEKALAVYQRVLEHDATNERARSAVETLAPAAPAEPAAPAAAAPAPAPAGGAGFVDLGAMLLEEEGPKDTRMRIEDEEPSGDEQKDFQTMLAAFKRGVDANVDAEDFQSHYDLGVAYKEMGLLDEAIAEFQKALRGTEGRLKASEALGLCFYEKGQFTVTETILRRGLELPASGDAERVGLLYWLGRTQEELGKGADALISYNRVFAVDITFQDVRARVKALSAAGV